MTLEDLRGEPLSHTTTRQVLDLHEQALVEFASYVGDPVATMDKALALDPDFILGHVLRATGLLLMSERRLLPEAARNVEAATALLPHANPRERGHVSAVARFLGGDWRGAAQAWDRVLEDHPRDQLALQAAHLLDFFVGDAINLRDRVARVLPHWKPGTPGRSYVLGMYAFGLEECNQYREAEHYARTALDAEPHDGWSVHALGHVMEMQARFDEAIAFYRARVQDWAPDNGFAFHNWWHLALWYVERAEWNTVLDLYDRCIRPDDEADISLQMLDASALLWRLHLYGVDTGDRFDRLAAVWERKAAEENGYYAFNDVHALMAYLCSGRDAAAERLLADMRHVAETGTGSLAVMTREVGLPVAEGLMALAHGRNEAAVDALLPVRSISSRYGGSQAQRDLIAQTLFAAALRAGRKGLAGNLANERVERKPGSPLAWDFMHSARVAAGDASGGASAAERAALLRRERGRAA